MGRTAGLTVAAIASIVIGACGGGEHGTRSPTSQSLRHSQGICGEALARVMRQAFISPSSSAAVRLRARKTLDLLADHRASVEPVCASRSSVEPTVSMP